MRRTGWLVLAAVMLIVGISLKTAFTQIVPALPFQLQNNTVADATQVMANFNQILNNVNTNSAKNGANSDITSLLGLTTPLSPIVGGTSTFTGGTSTGSANAQVVTPVVPATFTLATGNRVVFKAGFSNTAATTLNVSSTGATAVFRKTQAGPAAMVGGEILVGDMVSATYDGTQWQLDGPPVQVGEIREYLGAAAPAGWALADGTCISQTTYATLFTYASTSWGSCGAGLFALPDHRGRAAIGVDGGANRVTNGGSGCTATLAAGCGAQNQTLLQANFPNVNFNVTDPRTFATTAATAIFVGSGGPGGVGAGANATTTTSIAVTPSAGTPTAASGGSGTALTTLQPLLVVNKIVKL